MELAENGTLEDLLLQNIGEHPCVKQWTYRLRMATDIAKGMDFLHRQNPPIIHRDLKSANVLVAEQYCCKARIASTFQ
jgi:serine/threonine protein kinase